MCCRNRCRCRRNDGNNEVAGIQRIALRGPGCISGTGRCEGVLGTGCRCRCRCRCRCNEVLGAAEDFCEEVFGNNCRRCWGNVLGTGGCSNVLGTGGCGQILGTGGGFQCNNVSGTGGRRCRCKPSCWDLKTPTTVPR